MGTKGYVTVTRHKGQQRINMAAQGFWAERVEFTASWGNKKSEVEAGEAEGEPALHLSILEEVQSGVQAPSSIPTGTICAPTPTPASGRL